MTVAKLAAKSAALLGAAATIAVVAAPAFAGPAEDAVKARRGYYQLVRANAGPLFGMAKGDVDFNAEAAAWHVSNLQALASMRLSNVFVDGSDNGALAGETRALPAIWSDVDGFRAKHDGFAKAADALAGVDSLDALRAGIGGLGGSCKACHDDYRAKEF